MRDSSVTAACLGIVIPRRADGKLTRAWSSEDVEDALDDREQAASQLAENREQVRRMTRNPSVLRNSVSEDAEPLLKELLIAGMAHEKAVEDWRPYCGRGLSVPRRPRGRGGVGPPDGPCNRPRRSKTYGPPGS